jgi:hypothetical protein
MHLQVLYRRESKKSSGRIELGDGCKRLIKIYTLDLGIAFCDKPSLVSYDVARNIVLDFEDLLAPDGLASRRKIYERPGLVLDDRIIFSLRGLLPLLRVGPTQRLLEGLWFAAANRETYVVCISSRLP